MRLRTIRLNPYSIGMKIEPCNAQSEKSENGGLNPYSIGMKIEQQFKLKGYERKVCLNPYSIGMKIEPTIAAVIRQSAFTS